MYNCRIRTLILHVQTYLRGIRQQGVFSLISLPRALQRGSMSLFFPITPYQSYLCLGPLMMILGVSTIVHIVPLLYYLMGEYLFLARHVLSAEGSIAVGPIITDVGVVQTATALSQRARYRHVSRGRRELSKFSSLV